jgi:hypothetical protein
MNKPENQEIEAGGGRPDEVVNPDDPSGTPKDGDQVGNEGLDEEAHAEDESSRRLASRIKESLAGAGITLENLGELTALCGDAASRAVKVVAVPLGLREGIDKLNTNPRDRVVMVRVDKDTSEALDAWVQTGALKSRSEAAALFMSEGLKIRSGELSQLKEGLEEVEEAKRRLHERAREVLGNATAEGPDNQSAEEPEDEVGDKDGK